MSTVITEVVCPDRTAELSGGPDVDPEGMLRLALARPCEALARARALLEVTRDPLPMSYAQQAVGIVLRDRGQMAPAVAELRAALHSAQRARCLTRVADVRATLGLTLVFDGRTREGVHQLDAAASAASGELLAKVLLRRGYAYMVLGRREAALDDTTRALIQFRRSHNSVWQARALNNRGDILISMGRWAQAERDVVRAEALFHQAGQNLEAVLALHNRGLIAYSRRDLPSALALYDEAERRYVALDAPHAELVSDRCAAYLAAGLNAEAIGVVDAALATEWLQPRLRAQLELQAAWAALSLGDADGALQRALVARQLFASQGRQRWEALSSLVVVRARHMAGETSRGLLREALAVADRLTHLGAEESRAALLVAGRIAAGRGLHVAYDYFGLAATGHPHESALGRATRWLARALAEEARGDSGKVLRACARAHDALDEHRRTLGSSELRALASLHGEEQASLALRHALAIGTPRTLLRWTERWRAAALTFSSVRPPQEAEFAARLAELRDTTRRLDKARAEQQSALAHERDIQRLEQTIRSLRLRLGATGERPPPFDIHRLMDELLDTAFVELVAVDDVLHALIVRDGRTRHVAVGTLDDAVKAVSFARFGLRQAARGRPTQLAGLGDRLEAALLGGAVRHLGSGPVVVAPPNLLQATPWALMPRLRDRPVSTAPSASVWLRARSVPTPDRSKSVLVAGPHLSQAEAEVNALAGSSHDAIVLTGEAASADRVLAALDGAALGHIAAHGTFRRDSPLFSALLLADGPLTVHDFERVARAPFRIVLSACDTGVVACVGAGELLGLAPTLLSLGTAGVVASVAEVSDEETVPFMLDLHRHLTPDADLSEVLLRARQTAGSALVAQATAASFVAIGA